MCCVPFLMKVSFSATFPPLFVKIRVVGRGLMPLDTSFYTNKPSVCPATWCSDMR